MTYQQRETLIYRGEPRPIRSLPLEPHPNQIQIHEKHKFEVYSTGCYRGYVGTWEVRDDEFHLIQLETLYPSKGLAELFPAQGDSVKARWFSGPITPDDLYKPDWNVLMGCPEEEEEDPPIVLWDDRTIPNLWFALLVHRGDVLLEESVDLGDGVFKSRLTRHVQRLFPADELRFLRAIRADIDSPGPKWAYADWLERRGDPRAPLLRAGAERDAPRGWLPPGAVPRRDIPVGFVDPTDLLWYWRYLADIPLMTPEDRRTSDQLSELKKLMSRLSQQLRVTPNPGSSEPPSRSSAGPDGNPGPEELP
jgi:uncharacterized protein (TIGR02996 family)